MIRTRRQITLRGATDAASVRTARYDGRDYLVMPIVALVGDIVVWPMHAEGPEFVPAEELARAPAAFNGRPVVPDHPENGRASANQPHIMEAMSYGVLFNSRYEDGRLKVDAYLDPERAGRVGGDAVRVVEVARKAMAGEEVDPVEVSVGVWVDMVEEEGTAPTGDRYEYRWESIVPDHLAVGLNGSEGACSVEAGCGGPRAASSAGSGAGRSGGWIDFGDGVVATLHGAGPPVIPDGSQLRCAVRGQARRPRFSGTESVAWSAPGFADYVRYLDDSAEPPGSVREASATLRRDIAAHTLLGEADATNFRDLAFFPVVNPANGRLNENALRAVLGGRGAQADIPARALESARDMARRLLNSEYGAELEAAVSDDKNKEPEQRAAAESVNIVEALAEALGAVEPDAEYLWVESFDAEAGTVVYGARADDEPARCYRRSYSIDGDGVSLGDDRATVRRKITFEEVSEPRGARAALPAALVRVLEGMGWIAAQDEGTSDVELREAMWKALRAAVPGFEDIAEIFPETATVIYAAAPDPDEGVRWFRQTYDTGDDGAITLNDDAQEVRIEKSWVPATAGQKKTEDGGAAAGDNESRTAAGAEPRDGGDEGSGPDCNCNQGEGRVAQNPPDKEGSMPNTEDLVGRLISNEETPFTEDDKDWLAAKSEDVLRDIEARYAESAEGGEGEGSEAEQSASEPASEPDQAAESDEGKREADEVTLSKEELEDLRAAAGAWKAQQRKRKDHLVEQLKSAQTTYGVDELRAMSIDGLKKVADLVGINDEPAEADYSGRGMPRASREERSTEPLNPWSRALTKRAGGEKEAN